ncbi:MAG: hypothetical protein Q9163_004154 [Psora crenata]
MRPKVDGIWSLHNGLSNALLNFIILSSMVGAVDDPSQAAYVATSVFQDAVANCRNRKRLPAITLNLRKVIDIGIVAEKFGGKERSQRLAKPRELLSKTSTLLMVPLEEISASKSMTEYGMGSLIAVEMRHWIL